MISAPDLLDRLEAIVGTGNIRRDDVARADYRHDATFMEAELLGAVLPASTEEVAAVIRVCAETGTPVTARGAGTGLAGGPVPLQGGIVLSTERLLKLEIDAPNLMATAGTGIITGDLDAAAAAQGLMYPPDPASVGLSSIGGNVACNSGGMRCIKYGVTADYVVGMTVVMADGTVLHLGGKLRKRASGYRLIQLFVGSEGTLGIVTEVIVKLVPRPRHASTAMVGYATIEEAAEAVARLMGSGHFPAALEIVDRNALELVAEHLPPGFKPDLGAVLIVEQDGNDQEQVLTQLIDIVELLDGEENRVAQSEAERAGIWKARRQFGHILRDLRANVFSEDVAVPMSQVPEMVRRFQALSREEGVQIATVGHAGDGNLHPTLLFTDAQRPRVGRIVNRIFRDALELGGTVSAEHGLGALKRDFAELEHGPEAMALMRRIKQALDPQGILNPHKVFPELEPDDRFLDSQPGWGDKLASGKDRSEVGA